MYRHLQHVETMKITAITAKKEQKRRDEEKKTENTEENGKESNKKMASSILQEAEHSNRRWRRRNNGLYDATWCADTDNGWGWTNSKRRGNWSKMGWNYSDILCINKRGLELNTIKSTIQHAMDLDVNIITSSWFSKTRGLINFQPRAQFLLYTLK